jgi:Cu+-exporting ATPase
MVRRKFIQGITSAIAVPPAIAHGAKTKTVTWRIEGFSCITCAVGLDTLLRAQKGIVQSKSSYGNRTATIEFHPEIVTEKQIRGFIGELGFKARD